jgi:hypothetical protein
MPKSQAQFNDFQFISVADVHPASGRMIVGSRTGSLTQYVELSQGNTALLYGAEGQS